MSVDLPEPAKAAKAPVDLGTSDALSIHKNLKSTLKGRKIGILFAEGSDKKAIDRLMGEVKKAGGTPMLIAQKIGGIPLKGGTLEADGQLEGTPSVMVDAVALFLTDEIAGELTKDAAALDFVNDAWAHLKAIAHDEGAGKLLAHCGVPTDAAGVSTPGAAFLKDASRRFFDREPDVRNLA